MSNARKVLDRRFDVLRRLPEGARTRPQGGWVRAIRQALGMTQSDLAHRMGVSQVAVAKLEGTEKAGVIRLETLARAADALDCDLVYALVPRVTLEESVRRRAQHVVRRDFSSIVTTMRLEDQGLAGQDAQDAYEDLVETVIREPGLWRGE